MVKGSSGPLPRLERGAPLLARFRRLSVDDLRALDAAVAALVATEGRRHRSDMGFLYAWYEGPPLSRDEGAALDALFGEVCVAVATGVCEIDVGRFGRLGNVQQPGGFGGLRAWFTPPSAQRKLQDAAVGLLDDMCRPFEPRRAVVACWNVTCAAVMRDHLSAAVVMTLEAGWRGAFGEPPGAAVPDEPPPARTEESGPTSGG